MEIRSIKLVKKGKSGIEKEVTKVSKCGKEIKECTEMPKELDYFSVWEPRIVEAYLRGQDPYALRAGFLIDIQRVCTALKTKIDDLEREMKEVKYGRQTT